MMSTGADVSTDHGTKYESALDPGHCTHSEDTHVHRRLNHGTCRSARVPAATHALGFAGLRLSAHATPGNDGSSTPYPGAANGPGSGKRSTACRRSTSAVCESVVRRADRLPNISTYVNLM